MDVRRTASVAIFLLELTGVVAAADAPPGASSCSGCHATLRGAVTSLPRLVGRSQIEIVSAMEAFRTGQRPATVMDRVAKGFTEGEVKAIAAWYAAAQKD